MTDRALSRTLARHIQSELRDGASDAYEDLAQCGSAVTTPLTRAVGYSTRILDLETSSTGPSHVCLPGDLKASLETMFTLADEQINSVPFNLVSKQWLRLYTDCSIIRSLLDVTTGPPDESSGDFWLAAVKRLDMAIIVAGAAGEGRLDMVQDLIGLIQRAGLPRRSGRKNERESLERPTKKRKQSRDSLLYAPHRIRELDTPPSSSAYLSKQLETPFILRGYLSEGPHTSSCPPWSALQRWASAEYILDRVGEGRVVPVEVGKTYTDQDWGQRIVPLRDFLRRAGYDVEGESEDSCSKTPLYLAQTSLLHQFPGLAEDIAHPDYIWSSPPPPSYMPDYKPPQNDDQVVVNFWIGSGNGEVISPAHTDPYYNCYCQILGEKRIWLAPPSAGDFMAPHGEENDVVNSGLANKYMSNTSTVPILQHDDGFEKFAAVHPEFFEHVWPDSLEAILEPGDMLVMPPGWWHAMRGESDGVGWSVSMWY